MMDHFEKHRAKMTPAEERQVWGAIEGELGRTKRGWKLFGIPAAAVGAAAALVFTFVMLDGGQGPDRLAEDRPRLRAGRRAQPARTQPGRPRRARRLRG